MQQTDRLIFSAFLLALSECDRDRETQLSPPLKAIAPLLPENPSQATEKLLTLLHANDTKFLYNAYESYYNALHALYQANPQKSHILDEIEPIPENIPQNETHSPLENFDLSPDSWEKTKQVFYIQDELEKPTFLTRIKNIFNASHPIAESQKELNRPNNPQ
ncbi:MAG: hypothetical protein J7647_10885 [Cyanobacteria bacterium SBLK]|nr:hypothetical protein [Cyanobacteria bacterium SBLK]